MTDFEGLLSRLNDSKVRFIVIGGAAATAHGSSRLTLDLDVVYERSPNNLKCLVSALKDLDPYLRGAPPGLPFRWDEVTLQRGLNFTLTTRLGDLDILGEVTGGGSYQELESHCVTLRVFGSQVQCLDLDTLIRVKRAAGRPKDFDAIAELQRIHNLPGYDSKH